MSVVTFRICLSKIASPVEYALQFRQTPCIHGFWRNCNAYSPGDAIFEAISWSSNNIFCKKYSQLLSRLFILQIYQKMAAILAHLPQDLNLSDEASKIEEGEVKSNSNTSRISQLKERLNSLQIRQKIIIYVIIILLLLLNTIIKLMENYKT